MRLFVTVGAQMPFDRLVRAIDAWAGAHPDDVVFAQVGANEYSPKNIEAVGSLSPEAFARAIDSADAVVGHAGIGTLFAALERSKPIVVLPREASRQETRNDHQSATARRFADRDGVLVAASEDRLAETLEAVRAIVARGVQGERLDSRATGSLVETIARFIDG